MERCWWSVNANLFYHCCSHAASTIDCGIPSNASTEVIVQYNTTIVSSVIFYQCRQSGFAPSSSSAVCMESGRWSPDPSLVVCRMVTTGRERTVQLCLNFLIFLYGTILNCSGSLVVTDTIFFFFHWSTVQKNYSCLFSSRSIKFSLQTIWHNICLLMLAFSPHQYTDH